MNDTSIERASGGRPHPIDVLLVEDNDTDLRFVRQALAQSGYSLEYCRDGATALELLGRLAPRVLLTDCYFQPNDPLDGIGLCRHTVRDYPSIPTIVLTGRADLPLVIEAMRAGAFDFVTKDSNFGEFRRVLSHALSRALEQDHSIRRGLAQPEESGPGASGEFYEFSASLPLEEVERLHVLRVLESVQHNKTEAARILGLDRTTLYRKLNRYAQAKSAPVGRTDTGRMNGS